MTDIRQPSDRTLKLLDDMRALTETVLYHGEPMDWEQAVQEAAKKQGVPIREMRYALTNARSEKWIVSERLFSGDLSIPEPVGGSYHTASCHTSVPHVAHRHNGGRYDLRGYELCSGVGLPPTVDPLKLVEQAQELLNQALKLLKKD